MPFLGSFMPPHTNGSTRDELYTYFGKVFSNTNEPQDEVIRYVMLNREGKLSRPLMVFQTARAYGTKADIFPHATAVELVHRATLMLDDSPAMDNANTRQGTLSCWKYCAKEYGLPTESEEDKVKKGVAITGMVANLITGTVAPRLVDASDADPDQKEFIRKKIQDVSEELVSGQCIDLGIRPRGKRRRMSLSDHYKMHRLKTGSLYATSAQIGGRLGNASEEDIRRLGIFGRALGTAYQLVDDWNDLYGDPKKLGKPTGLDAANNRPNLASRLGGDKFEKSVVRLRRRAISELRECSADLGELIEIVERVTALPKKP